MKRLSDIGEDALIAKITSKLALDSKTVLGSGDDCAVISREGGLFLLKTDAIVSGVHFLPDEVPERIGWKAAARVLSDFAAMGGEGGALLVALAAAADVEVEVIEGVYEGLERCCQMYGASIVGGETSKFPSSGSLLLSISGLGDLPTGYFTPRSGGRPADVLFVTGRLGGSFPTGWHLDFTPRMKEGQWLSQNGAHAMMDLSDGLAQDLPRLAKASECGFQLTESSIPIKNGFSLQEALGDGEDYELLVATDAEAAERWMQEWPLHFPDLSLTPIGYLTEKGEVPQSLGGGWEHFTTDEGDDPR